MGSYINPLGLVKYREHINTFFFYILALTLIILAFFTGRVTKFMESSPAFLFESKATEEQNYTTEKNKLFGTNTHSTSTIVASSGGKKYYFVWCKGASNIKPNKKRYFDTEDLAQKAGYTLASNCK